MAAVAEALARVHAEGQHIEGMDPAVLAEFESGAVQDASHLRRIYSSLETVLLTSADNYDSAMGFEVYAATFTAMSAIVTAHDREAWVVEETVRLLENIHEVYDVLLGCAETYEWAQPGVTGRLRLEMLDVLVATFGAEGLTATVLMELLNNDVSSAVALLSYVLRTTGARLARAGGAHHRELHLLPRGGGRHHGGPADHEAHAAAEQALQRAHPVPHPVRRGGGLRAVHLRAPGVPPLHGRPRAGLPRHRAQRAAVLHGEPEAPAHAPRHALHGGAGHHDPVRGQHPAGAGERAEPRDRAAHGGVPQPRGRAAGLRGVHVQHQRAALDLQPRGPALPRHGAGPGAAERADARVPREAPREHRLRVLAALRDDARLALARARGPGAAAAGAPGAAPEARRARPAHDADRPRARVAGL